MMEEELLRIWKSSPVVEQVKFEKSMLMVDVQSGMDRFHRSMKWLYLREALGAIIAIPAFAYFGFTTPYLLTKIGSLLLVIWSVYLLFVIKRTRKLSPEEVWVNYSEHLQQTKHYLELQMSLRLKIFSWYILPCLSFSYVFGLGFVLEKGDYLLLAGMTVYMIVIGLILYFLNRRSARKFVAPKLEKVRALISSLEE